MTYGHWSKVPLYDGGSPHAPRAEGPLPIVLDCSSLRTTGLVATRKQGRVVSYRAGRGFP